MSSKVDTSSVSNIINGYNWDQDLDVSNSGQSSITVLFRLTVLGKILATLIIFD